MQWVNYSNHTVVSKIDLVPILIKSISLKQTTVLNSYIKSVPFEQHFSIQNVFSYFHIHI